MLQYNSRLLNESNRIGVQFLMVEVQTGLIFLDVADATERKENRSRGLRNAYAAYRNVLDVIPQVTLSRDESIQLESGLEELKSRLIEAGYSLDS